MENFGPDDEMTKEFCKSEMTETLKGNKKVLDKNNHLMYPCCYSTILENPFESQSAENLKVVIRKMKTEPDQCIWLT